MDDDERLRACRLSTGTAGSLANGGVASSVGESTSAASNLVFGGGTLQYAGTSGAASTDRLFTLGDASGDTAAIDSSSATTADTLTFSNAGSIAFGDTNAHTLTLTGSNTGSNTFDPVVTDHTGLTLLVKTGAGTWIVSAANTYSGGTTVNAGTLTSAVSGGFGTGNVTVNPTGATATAADNATVNTTGSITATATVTVNSETTDGGFGIGTVNFNGTTPQIGALNGNGTVVLNNAGGTTLTIGNASNNLSSTFSGTISDVGGLGSLATAGSGTLTLSGANTYGGGTDRQFRRRLPSPAPARSAQPPAASRMGGGTLDLGGTSQTVGAVTITSAAASGNTIQNGSLTGPRSPRATLPATPSSPPICSAPAPA